jgi:hypothetical protein
VWSQFGFNWSRLVCLCTTLCGQAAEDLRYHAKSWTYSVDPRRAVRDGCLALWSFSNQPRHGLKSFQTGGAGWQRRRYVDPRNERLPQDLLG